MISKQSMTSFWLIAWALALSVAWLLPNHYLPWPSFYMNAWMACGLLLGSVAVILRSTTPVVWHDITVLVAVLVVVPGLQYCFGMGTFSGTVWVGTAYLLGFLLVLLIGARWELINPGQLADGLFLAIGIAALLSVFLQLHQWLILNFLDAWSMGGGYGRPFANFGQPNQLATFLLWGLLAVAWNLVTHRIGMWVTLFASVYLLFGLALTQSRTAWIAVFILVVASWTWRRLWPSNRWPWVVTGLGLYFATCVISIGWLNQLFLLTSPGELSDITRISGELRPVVWSMFMDAALQHPFFGYGWDQGVLAHMTVALDHPALHVVFSHSHNFFLDLVLWCGIPVGLFISIYLIRWLWQCLRAVSCMEDAVLLLFLLVVINHAMLESPLSYAYFLLPVGLVMGILNVRLHIRPVIIARRWSIISVWLASTVLLVLIIRDYSRVEVGYQALRLEWAQIKTEIRNEPPKIVLLTQWREFIRLARFEPISGMDSEDLNWMRKVTSTYPSTDAFRKLAIALAINQRPEEARLWLKRMCQVMSESQCITVKATWADLSLHNPSIAAIPWPE